MLESELGLALAASSRAEAAHAAELAKVWTGGARGSWACGVGFGRVGIGRVVVRTWWPGVSCSSGGFLGWCVAAGCMVPAYRTRSLRSCPRPLLSPAARD